MALDDVAPRSPPLMIIGSTEVESVTASHVSDKFAELEFSDYGRSPRMIDGWWIVPGMLLGTAFLTFLR
jgi:hypothetical protein